MADTSELQARLRALRESYAADLPGKLDEIHRYWQQLATAQWSVELIEALHLRIHTLAGSGGTFGFNRLSEQARAVERVLKRCIEEKSQEFWDSQSGCLAPMLAALSQAASEPVAETIPLSSKGKAVAAKPPSGGRCLIYLVEDNTTLAESMALQLEHFGYLVRTFHGSEALAQALTSERPMAVVMDIVLPQGVMAGAKAIREADAEEAEPVPLIFISSRNDLQARLEAIRAGGDAYFVKPVDIHALIARLDKVTERTQPEAYRILIVEDDATLASHYALVLSEAGMDVETLTRPLEIMESLARSTPDLILMDVYMPDCSGLELAKLVRQQDSYLSIPIVFLSSEDNLDKQFRALRTGGDDFLTKPIADEYLLSSVSIRAERARLIRSLMAQDSLTGLLNHAKIKEQLVIEESRHRRMQAAFTFVMIDIDHFKAVNDNYGHMTGDRVIKSLSRLLQQRLRKSDSIGRYGGEEFAVILADCDVAAATRLLDDIRTSFAAIAHRHEGEPFSVTFSAGLASFPLCDSAAELNRVADEALYEAKRLGRNRVVAAAEPRQQQRGNRKS